jgi:hypothetical protein
MKSSRKERPQWVIRVILGQARRCRPRSSTVWCSTDSSHAVASPRIGAQGQELPPAPFRASNVDVLSSMILPSEVEQIEIRLPFTTDRP